MFCFKLQSIKIVSQDHGRRKVRLSKVPLPSLLTKWLLSFSLAVGQRLPSIPCPLDLSRTRNSQHIQLLHESKQARRQVKGVLAMAVRF